jgi:hypothetical protein
VSIALVTIRTPRARISARTRAMSPGCTSTPRHASAIRKTS